MNQAAARAGADPIQFRLDHTIDQRLIDVLRATAKTASWDSRPSPRAGASRNGIINPRQHFIRSGGSGRRTLRRNGCPSSADSATSAYVAALLKG
jgi:hypothetical protein